MKRNMFLVVSMLLLVLLVSAAEAQEQTNRRYHFFVAPEYSFMISPELATDYYVSGFGFSAGMQFPASPNWSFVGFLNYKTYSPAEGMITDWWTDEGEYPGSTNIKVSEGKLSAFSIAVQGKGTLKQETSRSWPYFKGGFGLTFGGADEVKVEFVNAGDNAQTVYAAGADDATNISVLIGLGFEFASGSGNTTFFAELGYEVVMLEGSYNLGVVPLRVGVTF